MLELKVAQRRKAKLKLGMSAPPGGGKTLGALLIAYGLMKEKYPNVSDAELWSKIAIIDTENKSGELYVGKEIGSLKIGKYNALTLGAPFEADRYTEALKLCFSSGMEVAIIDSTTHLWSGTGGLLEQQGSIAKRTGNSYTAWRDVTPQHNRFVEAMLQTDMHVIATMRSKVDYVQEKNADGKTIVRKVGLNPIQKEGMEYEFTVFLEIDAEHTAFGSKDRTSIVDQKYFTITPDTGRELMHWLELGTETEDQILSSAVSESEKSKQLSELKDNSIKICKELGGSGNEKLLTLLRTFEPSGNPAKMTKVEDLNKLIEKLNEMKKETSE